ncbi:Tyrosine specific protein phosphatases domain-containing protein [Plasmodiophora brassicae]|uniref:Tyrosine specific protein phosphatases domain-containing protein n=1 Tax=Plasmodiophora brassicae TaxID=37360 RepID=A0A0G4J117_PLABS|nr:hypothetical protein PBRA_008356 [Plasmodiophora brassicae]
MLSLLAAKTPILVHCKSGRDRTGIVVAVLVRVLFDDIDDEAIVAEYLQSDSTERRLIQQTLSVLNTTRKDWVRNYFRDKRFPVERLRNKFQQ